MSWINIIYRDNDGKRGSYFSKNFMNLHIPLTLSSASAASTNSMIKTKAYTLTETKLEQVKYNNQYNYANQLLTSGSNGRVEAGSKFICVLHVYVLP